MALKKTVTTKNGIVTEYHRVAMVSMEVNQQNTILLYSYLSEDGRNIEKDYAKGKYKDMDERLVSFPYVDAQYLHPDYDGTMTVEKAYEYLKTLPEFEGAEDV